ncbi:MAG TPA: ComEC/Rec2 family competence protein, partial [Tepidiformaceae bacterium]|nr:ComEC/Rec2 family competence protein [Tepidiformaceae bacterium]
MTLIVVGLCWVLGLLPVGLWDAPWWMGAAWLVASSPVALSVGPLKRRWKLGAAGLGASALAGFLLAHSGTGEAPAWANLAGSEVTIEGVVRSEPSRGLTTTTYEVRVDRIVNATGAQGQGGVVLAMLNQYDRYLPGDRVVLKGELDPPAKDAAEGYRAYLARRGVGGRMYRPAVVSATPGGWTLNRWLTSERLAFDRALQRSLPEPEASLAAGVAFGRADGLSPDVESTFNDTGLRHLVAVSGSNVTLVTALMYILFVPAIGRRWAWIPAGLAVVAYLGAAGLSPSVLRSGLMALTFLAGSVIGRPQSGLPGLCAAVIVMTTWSPPIARDPGFILSATATAGILTLYPNLHAALRLLTGRNRWLVTPDWVLQAASLTIASTIATTPVMWVLFGRVSLVSPLANIVVEPVFVLAFWGSMATAGVARVSPEAGTLLGDVAYYPLAFILSAAREFARVPLASVAVPAGASWVAAASYAALTPVAFLSYR